MFSFNLRNVTISRSKITLSKKIFFKFVLRNYKSAILAIRTSTIYVKNLYSAVRWRVKKPKERRKKICPEKYRKIDVNSTIRDVIGILDIGSTKGGNIHCLQINYFSEIPYTNVYMDEYRSVHIINFTRKWNVMKTEDVKPDTLF